jgi:hypothetical protein
MTRLRKAGRKFAVVLLVSALFVIAALVAAAPIVLAVYLYGDIAGLVVVAFELLALLFVGCYIEAGNS